MSTAIKSSERKRNEISSAAVVNDVTLSIALMICVFIFVFFFLFFCFFFWGGGIFSRVFAVRERMLFLITFDCLILTVSGHYFRSSDFSVMKSFDAFLVVLNPPFVFYHFLSYFNVFMSNVNKVLEFCVDWIPLTVTCLMGCIESRLRNMTSSTFLSFFPSLFNFFPFLSSISTSSNKKNKIKSHGKFKPCPHFFFFFFFFSCVLVCWTMQHVEIEASIESDRVQRTVFAPLSNRIDCQVSSFFSFLFSCYFVVAVIINNNFNRKTSTIFSWMICCWLCWNC